MSDKIEFLQAENTKLNADMKILRDEHTEVLHSLFSIDRKNTNLVKENDALKNFVRNTGPEEATF
jgi:cell division protein FtsB